MPMRIDPSSVALPIALLALPIGSPAEPGGTLPAIELCLSYEYSSAGSPIVKAATDCWTQPIAAASVSQVFEQGRAEVEARKERAWFVWERFRGWVRDHSFPITVRLRQVRLSLVPGGRRKTFDFPARGAGAIAYDRGRVWLPDGTYGFDYFRSGAGDTVRLYDVGKRIGAP